MPVLLLLSTSVFGMAYFVGHSKATAIPRELMRLTFTGRLLLVGAECPPCVSWWIGFALGMLHGPILFAAAGMPAPGPVGASLAIAFHCCGTSWCLARWTGLVKP